MGTRIKRAARELLGKRPRPKREEPKPCSFEEQIYSSVVRPGDVCFDVGANQGDVALFLSRLAGESGQVVAFEPVWPVYMRLCRNLQLDTYLKAPIITIPAGLADIERYTTVQVPDGEFGMGSVAQAEEWSKSQPGSKMVSYHAHFLTLDSWLASSQQAFPDFIKIDVEGAELLVLRGAARTFHSGARPLMLIEMFAPWEQAFGYQPWEPISWLIDLGYQLLFVCPAGLVEHLPSASSPFPPEYEQGYNVLAFIPDRHSDRIQSLYNLRVEVGSTPLPMPPAPRPNRVSRTD